MSLTIFHNPQQRGIDVVSPKLCLQDVSMSQEGSLMVSDSVLIQVAGDDDNQKCVLLSWSYQDEDLGGQLLNSIESTINMMK